MRLVRLAGGLWRTSDVRIMTAETAIDGVPFGRPYQSPFAVRQPPEVAGRFAASGGPGATHLIRINATAQARGNHAAQRKG